MLNNRFAGDIFPKVQRLADAGIEMNGQIVLCKGVNDGEELEYSIEKLTQYLPMLKSVSVVPVGLTKFREGLYPLESFEAQDAATVIDCIEKWQKKIYAEHGCHFIHASDEWYLLAGRKLPEEERYDGYLQLENGVGMLRLLHEETIEELDARRDAKKNSAANADKVREVSLATGRLAAPYLGILYVEIQRLYPNVKLHIYEIENRFFGEKDYSVRSDHRKRSDRAAKRQRAGRRTFAAY